MYKLYTFFIFILYLFLNNEKFATGSALYKIIIRKVRYCYPYFSAQAISLTTRRSEGKATPHSVPRSQFILDPTGPEAACAPHTLSKPHIHNPP